MKTPCKECPFLQNSAPGYLGEHSFNPKGFLYSEIDDAKGVAACHLSVDWEKGMFENATPCAGAMQFMNNQCQRSRVELVARLQIKFGKNDKVFMFRHEFIEHHSK